MIEESIGKGITKNADNSYTLDFKQDLGSGTWDGIFYVKVPPVTTGDEVKNSNISNEKNEINTKYIQNTTTLPAENYKPEQKGYKGYWTGTKINSIQIKEDLRPVIQARMAGLLESDLKDPNVLQGFLTNKLKLGNYSAADFNIMSYDEKLSFLTSQAVDLEFNNKVGSMLTKVGNEYYLGNPRDVNEVNPNPKTSGGSTTAAQEKTANLEKSIQGVWDMQADGTGSFPGLAGRSVSHSMGEFIIETPGELKGQPIGKKADVVKYLKDGSYNPK